MSARTKRKPKAVLAGANDPTPERMLRDAFDIVPAPRMEGEHIGRDKLASTRLMASRIRRMEREWITRDQGDALRRYEDMVEAAGYSAGRSCIDPSPRGGSYEAVIDYYLDDRTKLARLRNAMGNERQAALIFLDAVLWPYGGETLEDVAERMRISRGGRDARMAAARLIVTDLAQAIREYLDC